MNSRPSVIQLEGQKNKDGLEKHELSGLVFNRQKKF